MKKTDDSTRPEGKGESRRIGLFPAKTGDRLYMKPNGELTTVESGGLFIGWNLGEPNKLQEL